MLLRRRLIEQLDVDALPDDYGIDITLTLSALACDARIGQVGLYPPEHPTKEGNSERVMIEVATAGLRALDETHALDRHDVVWPDRYWAGWEWPRNGGIESDHIDVILRHAGSDAELESWLELGDATDDEVAEMWCNHLADAVRRSRAPHADLAHRARPHLPLLRARRVPGAPGCLRGGARAVRRRPRAPARGTPARMIQRI